MSRHGRRDASPESLATPPTRARARWVLDAPEHAAGAARARYITVGLAGGGVILVAWYLSLVILVAQVMTDPNAPAETSVVPEWLRNAVVWTGTTIGTWQPWAVVATVLGIVRADELARIATFSKRYLQNWVGDAELGLRDRVRVRILATLDHVVRADYDEIVVVGHSFGTILATDILADWPRAGDAVRPHLVTWGAPTAVMACRSEWLRTEVERLVANDRLARWVDVHATSDWLCSAFPGRARRKVAGDTRAVRFDAPFFDRMLGRTHLAYFAHPDALAPLLGD